MKRFQRNAVMAAVTMFMSSAYAFAQEPTDLLPDSLPSSMSSSAASPAEGGEERGRVTVNASERIARVNGQSTMRSPTVHARQTLMPRTHQVVPGDTLWDLSQRYLSDPFRWPALWSFNAQITNPHWIFPGDIIYLEPFTPQQAALTTLVAEPAPVLTYVRSRGSVRVPGMYISEMPRTRGHILFSDQEKRMLTLGDDVNVDWVDLAMRDQVQNGQQFAVFSESRPVLNERGNPMAFKIVYLGLIELVDVRRDSLSTARIIQASREIVRGDIILPMDALNYNLERRPNGMSMEARIIDTIDANSQLGEQQYAILNRGSSDGVMPGNSFIIFEQREGLEGLPRGPETETRFTSGSEASDLRDGRIAREEERGWILGRPPRAPEFPKLDDVRDLYSDRNYTTADLPLRKIGEVIVVYTQDKFSTGIIVDNNREIVIDTRVVMIQGY